MIRSMTGFGTAAREEAGRHLAVEIRSVNSRYFKVQVRVPDEIQGIEAELESVISRRLSRGSIAVTVRVSDQSAAAAGTINIAAVEHYLQQLQKVRGLDQAGVRIDLAAILALPGVMTDDAIDSIRSAVREPLLAMLNESIDRLIGMRTREGAALLQDLHAHCGQIAAHLAIVVEHVPQLIVLYQTKLRARMESLLAPSNASVREEDVLREVAVFAEKSDIAEEVARLGGHLSQFRGMIDSESIEPVGRTLDFIAQEMLREANTIGSKCLDVEVSRRIVEIKGAIDRIKEQVQNVE